VLPEQILNRFRVVSLERLERLEAAWTTLTSSPEDPDAAAILHRETHTLKGDSRMVGFTDVNMVCHKLEDLIELARQHGYRVGEDYDLAVTMAIRFMTILIRKKVGTELGGIDLPGFVQQIDGVLAEGRRQLAPRPEEPALTRFATRREEASALRRRIASPTIDVFLEGLRADRPRLRAAWAALRQLIAPAPPEPLEPPLRRHEAGARVLARDLGKQIAVRFELEVGEASPDVVAVLDVAVLHLVRNAIDHGIESSASRVAAGKPPTGTVTVRISRRDDVIALVVTDDGRGVDFERVRARAIELGLVDPAADLGYAELGALLLRPGFSTRAEATDVSGRGIGLDAVGAALAGVGGRIAVTSERGRGTTWTAIVPEPAVRVTATVFRAPGATTPLAVESTWQCDVVPAAGAIDPLYAIGVAGEAPAPRDAAIGLRLRRGGRTVVVLLAASPPITSTAESLISAADRPASIAVIDGVEGLLLHPELLKAS
jgi:two-component system chemotaxis sensor kinase CheA